MLACLIAIEVSTRFSGKIDQTVVAIIVFALAQVMCYAVALSIVIALNRLTLGLMLLLFIVFRELLVAALWRLLLRRANEDDFQYARNRWAQSLDAHGYKNSLL